MMNVNGETVLYFYIREDANDARAVQVAISLAVALTRRVGMHILGCDTLIDADGTLHHVGASTHVQYVDRETIRAIRKLAMREGFLHTDCTTESFEVQRTRTFSDTRDKDLDYQGVCVLGPELLLASRLGTLFPTTTRA